MSFSDDEDDFGDFGNMKSSENEKSENLDGTEIEVEAEIDDYKVNSRLIFEI